MKFTNPPSLRVANYLSYQQLHLGLSSVYFFYKVVASLFWLQVLVLSFGIMGWGLILL
jgi:hypothetical protein